MPYKTELSADFIYQLKNELDDDVRLLEELPERIAHRKKRYEAALLFAPVGFDPEKSVSVTSDDTLDVETQVQIDTSLGNERTDLSSAVSKAEKTALLSWASCIQRTLDSALTGMTHQEVLAKVKSNFPELPVSKGDKGFYNAIGKLSERGLLVKHAGSLYSPTVIESITKRGENLPAVPEVQTRAGSSGEIILAILDDHAEGLSAADLKKLVDDVPNAPKSLREHSQYIYNVLATLIGSGRVSKSGNLYRLAGNGKAPVGTGASL